MCNLYSQTKSQDAMRHVFDDMLEEDEELIDTSGNLPPMAGIFPDYPAPIIRHGTQGGWQLTKARWGMLTPEVFLVRKRTDPGVTNIRDVGSAETIACQKIRIALKSFTFVSVGPVTTLPPIWPKKL